MADVKTIFGRYGDHAGDAGKQDRLWQDLVWEVFSKEAVTFEEQLSLFHRVYEGRPEEAGPPFVYWPTKERVERSNVWREMRRKGIEEYRAFHKWSRTERAAFWARTIDALGIRFRTPPDRILDDAKGTEDPVWLPGARLNIVESCFKAEEDAIAVVYGDERSDKLEEVTYKELRRRVDRFTNGLQETGMEAGAAVALYMPMDLHCVVAYLGCIQAGYRVISIADSFSPPEIKSRLEIGGADAIVTVDTFLRGGKEVALYDKVKEAGAPRAIIIPADPATPPALREGDILWDDFLSDGDTAEAVACGPYDVTNVLFSSGTTGTPKAIPWTHLTPIKAAMDGWLHQDIQAGDRVAWPTNIGWMMGPWLIYAALINKATMAIYGGVPTSEGFCRFVERAGVTMLGVVPAIVRVWRNEGRAEGCDWSKVKVYSSTGESSEREDYLWLMSRSRYQAPIIEYCGGTEIGGGHITGTVVQPASPATFSTPALGLDLVILDEAGNEVPEGGMGEIFLVPPAIGLSQRLLNRDHHEEYYKDCPRGPKGEVLRRHGDEMRRLHRGFYQAEGRADDTMNLGGIKVSSLELERVMDHHEAVFASAAVAVRPEGGGSDRLVVFVVPAEEAEPDKDALKKELQAMVRKELNPLYKISDLEVVEGLPRTASNKIMRRKLRDRYQEEHAAATPGQ
ncbi:MAG: AMP-binding protein [Euryarchaeota archaeon]|nr:AMP-binding protein [Euryarchaeota archaeon]